MSLRLLLDEDSQAKLLVKLLTGDRHDVLTVNEAGLTGRPDSEVLDFARGQNRVTLTRNCADFQELHQENPSHPGIVAVYQSAETEKNMSYQAIVEAIANIEAAELPLSDQFVVLNQWKY